MAEMTYPEALDWYYDLVMAGNEAIANYDYELLADYEFWRREIKREMING